MPFTPDNFKRKKRENRIFFDFCRNALAGVVSEKLEQCPESRS